MGEHAQGTRLSQRSASCEFTKDRNAGGFGAPDYCNRILRAFSVADTIVQTHVSTALSESGHVYNEAIITPFYPFTFLIFGQPVCRVRTTLVHQEQVSAMPLETRRVFRMEMRRSRVRTRCALEKRTRRDRAFAKCHDDARQRGGGTGWLARRRDFPDSEKQRERGCLMGCKRASSDRVRKASGKATLAEGGAEWLCDISMWKSEEAGTGKKLQVQPGRGRGAP